MPTTSTAGSPTPLAEPVRRASLFTHASHDLTDAVARVEAVARSCEVAITDDEPDLVVVLGGDGTILRAFQGYLGASVPVLGVNFGRVGFLASMQPPQLEDGLRRVFAGEYVVAELPTIEADAGGTHVVAVNDVVGTSGTLGRMVELEWTIGGEEMGTVPCDGIICSTPSGSTAYNLSNGGPVLMWGIDAIAVTFVAPHSLHARPVVVPRNREVRVRNVTSGVPLAVIADGHRVTDADELSVRLGEQHSLLATLPEATFVTRYRQTFAS